MKLRLIIPFLYLCQILTGQSVWSGNIEFQYSGLANGDFSAETMPDSLEIPTEGTFASITLDSLGGSNILIPSFKQSDSNDEAYDIFLMYMKDSDGEIEPQSWNVELVDPTNIFDISATMIYMTEVDTAFLLGLIDPIINGEVDTENWSEYLAGVFTQILGASYLPISGTIAISEISEDSFAGEFSGLMGELGWPPQIIYIDEGAFNYTNPFAIAAPDAPTNLSALNSGDNIELSWDYPDSALITHFNIYHSFNGNPFEYLNFTDFLNRSWIHSDVELGVHAYYITAVSGIVESDPSEITEIEFMNAILGDVNGDGVINVLDIVQLVNIILGVNSSPTENELWAADVNQDSEINILDVVSIVNLILD